MPQIEVTFDIDANGILHVSAKDKAHRQGAEDRHQGVFGSVGGRDQADGGGCRGPRRARTRSSVSWSMTRNRADALVHQVDKSLKDLGDKVAGEDRAKIEAALSDLKTAMTADEKDAIDAKAQALSAAAGDILQRAQAGAAEGAGVGCRRRRRVVERRRARCRVRGSEEQRSQGLRARRSAMMIVPPQTVPSRRHSGFKG
jgi:molecular chaperone DnaK